MIVCTNYDQLLKVDFPISDDWSTAMANVNQLVDPLSEQSLSCAIRLYISAPKDAQAEVDHFVKVEFNPLYFFLMTWDGQLYI